MYEKKVIGLEEVQKAIEAMIKEGSKARPVSIAVVDDVGEIIALVRMDGARGFTNDMAIKKAYTSARWRRDTRGVGERLALLKQPSSVLEYSSEYSTVPGGIVVVKPGEEVVYGAIGVSGRRRDDPVDDEAIAKIGLKVIQAIL